jgi:hypothetical protein
MEEQHRQTVEEALWGYKDQHGKWTPGLVQQFSCSEKVLSDFQKSSDKKLNLTLGLVLLSFGRAAWPDIAKALVGFAQANGLH